MTFSANGQPQTQTVSSQSQIRVQQQQQQIQGIQVQQQPGQQQQQQFVTLPGGQQVAVRMAASAQPQVMQFPAQQAIQQMVPVQIPVSQNGQTVYQTVQMPIAAQAIQTAMIPQVVQTSAGQQIVMQQVQIAQPQIAQPQFASILMPNGQIQQVPVVQPQMLGGIGGIQIPQQQQIAIQTTTGGGSAVTTTTSTASSAVSSPAVASTATTNSSLLTAKVEPVEIKSETPDEPKSQQQQQFVTMNLNGQQVMVQQPMGMNQSNASATNSALQQVIRTANGQVIQVHNPGAVGQAAVVQAATPQNSLHIPGLGAVQIMNPMTVAAQPATAATAATQFATATAASRYGFILKCQK